MTLSDGEKLILVMLSEIHEHLKIENGVDPRFVQSAITHGHLWALKRKYPGIFHGSEPTPEVIRKVGDILTMWSLIERSYEDLSPEDKAKVATGADPFGHPVQFRGFDGNTEADHIGVARVLVDQLESFQEFKGRDLDSHLPSLDGYRRMLAVFEPLRSSSNLTAMEIIKLLKEGIHPERRKGAAR